jgi:hypothetical protein
MFSEKLHLVEKYNLATYEYVGTYENMFIEFTSIKDEIYKPELEDSLISRFDNIIKYKFNNNSIPFKEGETFFGVNYLGGHIINYDLHVMIDYNLVRNQPYWEDFLIKTDINQISSLKRIIDEKISVTDVMTNYISRLVFDKTGKVTGIGIYDTKYKPTTSNSDLDLINSFSNNDDRYNNFVIFNVDGTYKSELICPIPIIKGRFENNIDAKNLVIDTHIDYDEYNDSIIVDMVNKNIINQDDADYIKSHLTGKQTFNIEFDLDKNEKIINKTLEIVKYNLFEEL